MAVIPFPSSTMVAQKAEREEGLGKRKDSFEV